VPLVRSRSERLFRAGDWVKVNSAEEILGTLDDRCRLDGLPFMPEMLQYCGKSFRISKSAHKTCDTIKTSRMVWMPGAVHLEGLRCGGTAHGGCQALCLLFWKTEWLTPLQGAAAGARLASGDEQQSHNDGAYLALSRSTTAAGSSTSHETIYTCQATDILGATTPISWWNPRQYVWDLATGNIGFGAFFRFVGLAAWNMFVRWRRSDASYPNVAGLAEEPVQMEQMDLKPGELVEIRSRDEIMRTIGANRKHKGLWFDVEMEAFCGGRYRVLSRVKKIVNEKTGKMIHFARDCLILENVSCGGCRSKDRLFCPRAIYPYWREGWLKRVSPPAGDSR
jgi:hypothetical protein